MATGNGDYVLWRKRPEGKDECADEREFLFPFLYYLGWKKTITINFIRHLISADKRRAT